MHCVDTYKRIAESGNPSRGRAVIEKLYKMGDIPEYLYDLAIENIEIEEQRYNRENKFMKVLLHISISDLFK